MRLSGVVEAMEPDLELTLVRQLRAGESGAFDAIYESYNQRLFQFLRRMARDRDVAEDLLEETWLRLVRSSDELREDTRLGPWLFTVARNLYRSHCRSRLREEAYTSEFALLWPAEVSRSPHDLACMGQLEERLGAALDDLPPLYREAVLLVGVEGFSPSEAASVCGATAEALRQRLSRARAILAERLREEERVRVGGDVEVLP